jgi:predicted small secreted protein
MPMTDEEAATLKADHEKALKAQSDELAKHKAELEALKKAAAPPAKDDPTLEEKVRLQREAQEKTTQDAKRLESAIRFTVGSKDWLKTNEALLPKSVPGIFEQAEKENYANAIEKDAAIKTGIISEFFAQQANLDLLTDSQKFSIEEFRKLTKNVKQERAQQIYESIFEPTFEALKRQKKAEQISKGGISTDNSQEAYKNKMIAAAKKRLTK